MQFVSALTRNRRHRPLDDFVAVGDPDRTPVPPVPLVLPARRLQRLAVAAVALCGLAPTALASSPASAAPVPVATEGEALAHVNAIRQMSGLPVVTADAALADAATKHSCWMVQNDTISHVETPGTPGYTPEGHESGQKSNVAVSSSSTASAGSFVELWMTGPYHAVGVLAPGLQRIGYGQCTDDVGTWRSAATLDVMSGDTGAGASSTVVFPGRGATIPYDRFIVETPNPLANCTTAGVQWTTAGLPIVAILPEAPSPSSTATLVGPDGAAIELCIITEHDDVSPLGAAVLKGRRAVVAIPRHPLANGTYSATLSSGATFESWSFTVDTGASLVASGATTTTEQGTTTEQAKIASVTAPSRYVPAGPTRTWDTRHTGGRLSSGVEYVVPLGDVPSGATSVVAALTVVDAAGPGWLALYPCGQWGGTSVSNFVPGRTEATTAIIPLGADGVCARTEGDAHLVVDVSGWMVTSGGAGYVADESRVFDSRTGAPLTPGSVVRVVVADAGAVAAAVNVTAVDPASAVYLTVWPCASTLDPVPEISLGQGRPGAAQAAFGIVPVAADGAVCLYSSADSHVVVDSVGSFQHATGASFVGFAPVRRYDTRRSDAWAAPTGQPGAKLGAGDHFLMSLGVAGMPQGVRSVLANLTITAPEHAGWFAANPCGGDATTSDLNFLDGETIANMSVVPTGSPNVDACGQVTAAAHLVVDVFGVFVG